MSRLEDRYKSTIHDLVRRMLILEKWRRDVTGDSPLFDIANEHTPSSLSTDQNNYDPGWYDVLRINATADISITGITKGKKGRFLEFINIGTGRITFPDESGSSLAANRISTPYDQPSTLLTNARATFYYDSTNQRWTLSDAPNISGLLGKTAVIGHSAINVTNVPNDTETVLTPDTVLNDDWDYWDAVNFRFQIPSTEGGVYLAAVYGFWEGHATVDTLRQILIYRGAIAIGGYGVPNNVTSDAVHMNVFAPVRLTGGQNIEFRALQKSGGSLNFRRADSGSPVFVFSKLE